METELLTSLRSRGWEQKAGHWWAPTPEGKLARMWADTVLDGPMPLDAVAQANARMARASLDPLYVKTFYRWLQTAVKIRDGSLAFAMLPADEQKALAEGTDTTGGFAVPAELSARIITVIRERSIVRRFALELPCSTDALNLGQLDYNAEWVGEVPASTDTTGVATNVFGLPIQKARVKVKVSNDLLSDQPALEGWLTQAAGLQLSLLEDQAFVAGGGRTRPLGIVNTIVTGASANTVDVTGTTAHTISNNPANLGSAAGIIKMAANLPDAYRFRARWFALGSVLAEIRQLVDGASRYLFPSRTSPTGEDMLEAWPISTSSAMSADGTAGARVLALVDLSQYVVANRTLITVRVMTETYGDTDQTLVVIEDRIGGALTIPDACRIGTVT